MKTYLECIPCFFKQAIEASALAGASHNAKVKLLNDLASHVERLSMSKSPPEMGRTIYRLIKKHTGKKDPFYKVKRHSNEAALEMYPKLKRKVAHSKDRLLAAIELAIAGNIIDYGVATGIDVEAEIRRIFNMENRRIKKESSHLFNYSEFKRFLNKSGSLLYLGDNSGEIVFDRILIEEIKALYPKKRLTYVVKEKPIINDALMADARQCGLDKIVPVISSGLDTPGTVLSLTSRRFKKAYRDAEAVVSKGQGNFEALEDGGKDIFYLFMAKCQVVARHIGCEVGSIVLYYNKDKLKGPQNVHKGIGRAYG